MRALYLRQPSSLRRHWRGRMTLRNWLGLTAIYTAAEDAVMAELKRAGCLRELQAIHELKALCKARIVNA